MPDHAHLVVQGTNELSDLQILVRVWKQHTAFNARRRYSLNLWQRGYYEHVLRGDESILKKVLYVIENPVRANLVRSAAEYPWLGSFVATVEELIAVGHDRDKG